MRTCDDSRTDRDALARSARQACQENFVFRLFGCSEERKKGMRNFFEILLGIFSFGINCGNAENPTESEIWLNEETQKPVGKLGSNQKEIF